MNESWNDWRIEGCIMDATFGAMECLPEEHPLSEVAGAALLIAGGLLALAAWGMQDVTFALLSPSD